MKTLDKVKTIQEKKVRFVILVTILVIVIELIIGLNSKSLAIISDSIHMSSHIIVLGINWAAYILIRKLSYKGITTYNSDKILSLFGFTGGLFLCGSAFMIIGSAFMIITESFEHIGNSSEHITNYNYAIVIAIISLITNLICAIIMHNKNGKVDYNSRVVYLHLLTDVITKFGAIIGLISDMLWNILWIDTFIAIISATITVNWAKKLLIETGKILTKN